MVLRPRGSVLRVLQVLICFGPGVLAYSSEILVGSVPCGVPDPEASCFFSFFFFQCFQERKCKKVNLGLDLAPDLPKELCRYWCLEIELAAAQDAVVESAQLQHHTHTYTYRHTHTDTDIHTGTYTRCSHILFVGEAPACLSGSPLKR